MIPLSAALAALVSVSNVSHTAVAAPVKRPALTMTADSSAPIRVAIRHRTTLIPRSCGNAAGSYDVLIHFHGVETAMAPAYLESGLQSVLVIVNLGEFSGPYESQYAESGSLGRLIDQTEMTVKKHCPTSHLGRVALSAWSGGYGAIYRILARPAEASRVDAILLADGLHVGFSNQRTRQINDLQMVPFARFSEQAARGERLFAITHTEIKTPYASTTETADYLLRANGAARTAFETRGPRPGMTLASSAAAQGLRVFGYRGNDQRSHCDHLHAIGQTLLLLLQERWGGSGRVDSKPAAPESPQHRLPVAFSPFVAPTAVTLSPLTAELRPAQPAAPFFPSSTESSILSVTPSRPWAPPVPADDDPNLARGQDATEGSRDSVLPDWLT